MMRKKSFGKLAVVLALAALMLFGLCVCSKKDTTTSTTTQAATTTAQTTTTTPAKEAVTTPVETKVEETPVETKVEETPVETKVEETAVTTEKVETAVETAPVEEASPVEAPAEKEAVKVADDGTISGSYSYNDYASASFVMEGSKATITYPAHYIYKEDIDSFMALCVEKYPEYLSSVYYEIPEDGTLVIYYPEEFVGGLYYRLGVLDYLNGVITSYIDAYVASVVSEATAEMTVESADEGLVYSYTLDYKGVRSEIRAYSTYAVVTVPEGMTEEDIMAVKDMLVAQYPAEAALVTYKLEGDTLTLMYPEQSSEFIIAVVNALRYEAVALIDSLSSQPELEEVPTEGGHVYAGTLSYKGLSTTITLDNTMATLTVPAGIEKDDIDAVAYIVSAAYPEESSLVTYSFENGVLTLYYPEQTDEFLLSSLSALKEGGMYLVDLYGEVETAVAEAAETVIETVVQVADAVEAVVDTAKALVEGFDLVVEEDGTIRATFNYHDFAYASVVVEEDMATITYPAQYIASSDIDAFMAEAVAEFPELLENVYYDVPADGTLVIYFPGDYVGGTYYRLSVLDELDEEVTAYIDALVADLEAETEVEEVTAAALEGPVYAETLTYRGVTSSVVVDKTYASFTIPAGMDKDDIEAVAELVNYLYPAEASLLTYSIDGDTLTVTYPEQRGEFLLSALTVLREEAVALIDDILAYEETAVAEAPAVEKGAVYEDTLYYKNVTSKVAVYNTYAVLTLPEGTGASDVKAVADMIAAEYKEAALVTYTLDGNTLTLSYPEQSDAFLLGAVKVLRAEAVAYIDSLDKTVVKAEAPVEAPAVAETVTVPAETVVAAAEAEATAPAPLETPAAPVEAVSPVSAPVVAEKEKAFKGFSIAATATPKYNIKHSDYGWANGFVAGFGLRAEAELGSSFALGLKGQYDLTSYAMAGAYVRWTFASLDKFDFYALVGGGVTFGIGANKGQVAALVEAGLGVDYRLTENFSIFAEVTGQWTINKKPGIEVGGTVGFKYTF